MSVDILDLWWRYVPREAYPGESRGGSHPADRIVETMAARWGDQSPLVSELFRIAGDWRRGHEERAAAILGIAMEAKSVHRMDAQMRSLIFAAALLHNPVAIALHLDALRVAPQLVSDRTATPHIRQALRHWVYELKRLGHVSDFRNGFAAAEACLARAAEAVTPRTDGIIYRDGRAALQVLAEIGDAGSREGKELAKLYADLAKPLPLKAPVLPLDVLADQLVYEFPWMEDLVSSLIGKLRLRTRAGLAWLRLPPLLLVGPPGCGKTRFARRLAELAGCGHQTLSVGGSSDNRMLAGTARGWSSAQPCLPIVTMRRTGTANPLIVVDELEKATSTHNGSVHATLLGFLEPETARAHFDECLLARVNLGEVSWVATANGLRGVPEPLLSRLHVERVGMPGPEHFGTIVEALRQEVAAELGVGMESLPELAPGARDRLRSAFIRGTSLRVIKRAVAASMEVEGWQPRLN